MERMLALGVSAALALAGASGAWAVQGYDDIGRWGSLGSQPGHYLNPVQAGVGWDGSVYVADIGTKRIQKLFSTGEHLLEWGTSGKQPGGFYYPSGIAAGADAVYVADRDLHRVQKFTTDGEFVSEWGRKGAGDGQFFFPGGLAVHDGTVYVVDTGNQRVQAFDADGAFLYSAGSSGLGPGMFVSPSGIDADSEGNIHVTDRGAGKIEVFAPGGGHVETLEYHYHDYVFSPGPIALDPDGGMFVLNTATGTIMHLGADSGPLLRPAEMAGPYRGEYLGGIADIDIGYNGELLVVDSSGHTIRVMETPFYEDPGDFVPYSPPVRETAERDRTKPVIVPPGPVRAEAAGLLTRVDLGAANATDAGGIKAVINNAPELFPLGRSSVIWIAFDGAGNTSSAYQDVTVVACGRDVSSYNVIEGTEGDDVLAGTGGDDLIFGLGGDDLIQGGPGGDCIYGGPGDDLVSGNAGSDTLKGGPGDDVLRGGAGADFVYTHAGLDVADGGDGRDRCHAGPSDVATACE